MDGSRHELLALPHSLSTRTGANVGATKAVCSSTRAKAALAPIFPAEGAHPYKRDLKDVDFHLLDTGHFALEEDHDVIAALMQLFWKSD
jgi:hypothetical protein